MVITPKSFSGKLSVICIVVFFICFSMFQIFVAMGERGGETFSDNLKLGVPAALAAISGIAAFFTGIFGILKDRERSVPVFVSTGMGFLILFFCFGEIMFPH